MSTPPALPTSDPEPASLDLPDGSLSYVDEGPPDAPVLIAVHGIPGSARDFRYLAPQVTPWLRFIRIDLPGFGGSAPRAEAIETLPGRARVVMTLADRLGIGEFGVLGHSMGGGTALVLAASELRRVRRLVLVASLGLSLHRGLGASPSLFRVVARTLESPVGSLIVPLARAQYRKRRFPGVDTMSRETFARQFRAFGAVDFDLLRKAVAGALLPTLVAYARDDHMVETEISETLARALPAARVLPFDEGGHNLQKTRAVELGQAIRDWWGDGTQRSDISANPISL